MSKAVPWSRYIKRKNLDLEKLLSRFDSYAEFCQWFQKMGGRPPAEEEVKEYFLPSQPTVPLKKKPVSPPHEKKVLTKPTVSMKNTKVQLLEFAASYDVIVSYYDTKSKILQKMEESGKFIISSKKG